MPERRGDIPVEFRILGSLEAVVGGRPVDLGPPKRRVLLAVLLLECGRCVPVDRLVDLAWEEPPPAARRVVFAHIAMLRKALAPAAAHSVALLSTPPGYTLKVERAMVDAHLFRQLVRDAAAVEDAQARADLLRDALGLWRGPPLHDVTVGPDLERICHGLDDLRLAALEDRIEADLAAGRHSMVRDELAGLVAQHPLRERLAGQLMLVLYRCGDTGQAVELYQQTRAHLAAELGLDPGPELSRLHAMILRRDRSLAAPRPTQRRASQPPPNSQCRPVVGVPAQLPLTPVGFVGRSAEIDQLDALLADARSGADRTMVATICGTAGVGKTSLMVYWAYKVQSLFPDGQLYIDLSGHSAGSPMRPIEALAKFLRALGVSGEQVPLEEDEAAALYRSLVARKRMLILLDNAHSAEQARPLLPGGRNNVVVVTSRERLAGLVAREGAHPIVLDVLSQGEALALLGNLLEDTRIASEPGAAADLVHACARLPLALRIAAANLLCNRQQTISGYLTELTADGLAALEVDGDRESAVRAAFDISYHRLAADDRGLFRLLGLIPGPDATADAAAALTGRTPQWARRALDRLASAHLLDQRARGRFTFHDLLRSYAREHTRVEDPETDRQAALGRLLDWYLQTAEAAAGLVCPQMLRVPAPVRSECPPLTFDDHLQAASWLDAERLNLLAATRHAAAQGPLTVASALADAMRGFFWLSPYTFDWLTSANAGLAAAEADGDLRWQAAAHQNLGHVQRSLGRHEQAIEHLARSLELCRQVNWRPGEANARGGLGIAYGHTGQLELAAEHLACAMAINRELGRRTAEADNLSCLGMVLRQLGRLEEAADHHARARLVCQESGARVGDAHAANNLGCTLRDLGRLDQALYNIEQALDAHRAIGDRRGEAIVLCAAADVHCDAGRYQQALDHAHACLAMAEQTRDGRIEAAVHNTLGNIRLHLDQYSRAVDHHRRALRLARETSNVGEEADALLGIAAARLAVDEHDQARDCADQAFALARQAGLRILEGHTTTTLAGIDLAEGNADRAAVRAELALIIHRETGHRLGIARTLQVLAVAIDRTCGAAAAQPYWQEAHDLFADIGCAEVNKLVAQRVVASAARNRPNGPGFTEGNSSPPSRPSRKAATSDTVATMAPRVERAFI